MTDTGLKIEMNICYGDCSDAMTVTVNRCRRALSPISSPKAKRGEAYVASPSLFI